MSIPQLKNPKQLSYSGMRKQVRELARRMNILTEMRAVTIESTAAAKFTFSGDAATLDVPSVEDAVDLLECLEEKETLEAEIVELEAEIVELEAEIAEITENFCQQRDSITILLGVGEVEYFQTISVDFFINDGVPGTPQPVSVTIIIYKEVDGGWGGYYASTGPSALFRWTIRGPRDPFSDPSTYTPTLGPKVANGDLTFFIVDPDEWLDKKLTYNGYYSLLESQTQTNGPFGTFPSLEDYNDICEEPVPVVPVV